MHPGAEIDILCYNQSDPRPRSDAVGIVMGESEELEMLSQLRKRFMEKRPDLHVISCRIRSAEEMARNMKPDTIVLPIFLPREIDLPHRIDALMERFLKSTECQPIPTGTKTTIQVFPSFDVMYVTRAIHCKCIDNKAWEEEERAKERASWEMIYPTLVPPGTELVITSSVDPNK